jgi:hypothetical protein
MKIQGLIDGICEIIRSKNRQAMHRNTLEVDSDAPALVLNFGEGSLNGHGTLINPATKRRPYE